MYNFAQSIQLRSREQIDVKMMWTRTEQQAAAEQKEQRDDTHSAQRVVEIYVIYFRFP